MSETLIISDNEILNQLYVTNLEVYLATKPTLTVSLEEALKKINNKKFDLIICMSMMNGHETAQELFSHLKKIGTEIPLIIIGKPSKDIVHAVVINSSYNLQNLIQSCAKILNVTAKQMASLELPEYYSVDAKFLSKIKEIPCSVFLQTKEEFTMIAKKGDSANVIRKFEAEGINFLFVNSADRLKIINCVSESVCEMIKNTEGLDTNAKSNALNSGFEFVASTFGQSPECVTEIMNVAVACTKVMDEVVKDTPTLKGLLNILNSNKSGYVYSHTMLAAFVSNHIIRNVTWGGETHIDKINFVLFFHDIMLAPIYLKHPELKYEEDLLFSEALTDKEKEVVLNHARLAAEMMLSHKRSPIGSDLLIKQHHGMTSGVGFALEYKDDISPLSKIVLISEAFVEEFMKQRDDNTSYVLDIKKVQASLIEKFRKSTYKKIIETLDTLKM
jgi:CheY-like chemotaxis protein/response regulator RpfG family c-di-GMP phosphodiesterase